MAFFENLFNDFTDTVGEVQCGLGFHKGDWVYTNNDKCEQKRTCERRRCYDVSYRDSHEGWSNWEYIKPHSCLQERFCKRCKHREERTHHLSWTEWKYIAKGNCLQVRNCARCSKEETKTSHEYGDEKYYSYTKSCEVHELCKRCGNKKHLFVEAHNWVVIKHPSIPNKYRRYCPRCNKHEDIQST